MSTAATIIVDALAFAEQYDEESCTTIISGLLATSQLRNALAPRISAARPLTARMFNIVAAAPTAWCAADLRLVSPTAPVLQQTSAVFVQLQSIFVRGAVRAADVTALTAMPALLNQRTLRVIGFGPEIAVTDDMLRDGFAVVAARLETLIIGCGAVVTNAGLLSLCGTPMIATLRKFSLTGSDSITDAGVAAVLGPSSEMRSLTLRDCRLLSGAFLTQLHENCHDSLSEIDLSECSSIDNAGAAALCSLRGLTELDLSEAPQLSVLPLERLPPLRAVNSNFLSLCSGLTTLDLAALTSVVSVDVWFLCGCSGLRTLDLAPLANVVSVGDYFLWGCVSLTTLDLSRMTSLKSIGRSFLCGSYAVKVLDLSGLTRVESIGESFLRCCAGLTTLDLTPLTNVTHGGNGFLGACGSLKTLRLSDALLQCHSVPKEHKRLHARMSAAAARATS